MLALRTGWTPDVIAGDTDQVSDYWRRASHWALYAETLVGPNGLPNIEIPKGLPPAEALQLMRQSEQVSSIRAVLFPED